MKESASSDGVEKSVAASGEPDAPPPGDADMPPLESLGPESDYSGFMSPGVSEELRRLALRKLFRSPLYNITDGLDDYDDDFRSFAVLNEAFHAKRARSAEAESSPPERAHRETVGDAGPARPERSASAEVERGTDTHATAHPDGEAEEEAAKPAPLASDAPVSASPPAASGDAVLEGEDGVSDAGTEPDDADSTEGPVERAARRATPAASSGEREEGEEVPSSSARSRADGKAPATSPERREEPEERDAPVDGSRDRLRHG